MRGLDFKLQYEGLHDICFKCGKYGHREVHCIPMGNSTGQSYEQQGGEDKSDTQQGEDKSGSQHGEEATKEMGAGESAEEPTSMGIGPWMVAQKFRRRPTRNTKGNWGNSKESGMSGDDHKDHNHQAKSKAARVERSSSLRFQERLPILTVGR